MITTIICPVTMDHPAVNTETAPIWVDSTNNQYRIASGILQSEVSEDVTDHQTVMPDAITIISHSTSAIDVLTLLGLKPNSVDYS